MAKGRPSNPDRAKSHSSGHRALPGEGESSVANLVPVDGSLALREPPAGLPQVGADTWRVILSDMAAMRTLREVDLPLVLAYCEAVQVHAEASRIIHDKGVLVAGKSGPIPNPLLKVQKDAATTMRQLSDVLGLNPLARIHGNLMEAFTGSMIVDIRARLLKQLDE